MAGRRFKEILSGPLPARPAGESDCAALAAESRSPAGQAGSGLVGIFSSPSSGTIFRSCRTSRQGPIPHHVGWKAPLAVACVVLALEAILAWSVGIGRPFRGDEPHFVETIIQFGTRPLNLDLLTHYNEMSGPVPFVLYGTWGRVFGFGPPVLRLFSVVVALATYLLWYWFLHSETGSL